MGRPVYSSPAGTRCRRLDRFRHGGHVGCRLVRTEPTAPPRTLRITADGKAERLNYQVTAWRGRRFRAPSNAELVGDRRSELRSATSTGPRPDRPCSTAGRQRRCRLGRLTFSTTAHLAQTIPAVGLSSGVPCAVSAKLEYNYMDFRLEHIFSSAQTRSFHARSLGIIRAPGRPRADRTDGIVRACIAT